MTRFARSLLGGAAVTAVLAVTIPQAAEADTRDRRQAPPEAVLTAQTTVVDPGGTFTASVLVAGLPATDALRLVVHDRVRSRSELAASQKGTGSGRAAVGSATFPLAGLPTDPDGSRHVEFALGTDTRAITTPGVYPVEIEALDAGGAELDTVVTDLVVRPTASDATPPLAVAVVAQIGTEPGHVPTPATITALAQALTQVGDVVATLAVGPAELDDLSGSDASDAKAAVAALATAAADHPLLRVPYVPVSPDALTAAGIADELPHQLDRGTAVLEDVLGTSPSQRTWFATPDLATSGLRLLSALGIDRAVVAPTGVERVVDGVLSPARPFELAPPKAGSRRPAGPGDPVSALVTDARLVEALHADVAPALVAARALAELAMLWFEQPGVARAVVAEVDPTIDPAAITTLLSGLRAPELFAPTAIDAAFTSADPLEDAKGSPLRRSLSPDGGGSIPAGVADAVRALRSERQSVVGMVGDDGPEVATLDGHLLRATGSGISTSQRRREVDAARDAVAAVDDAVSTPEAVTITLTARSGTVPLTIRNDTGRPVDVQLRFRSPKLELPGGQTRAVTLTEPTTRLDIAVRTRTSGAFPFEVDVTSPDGALTLATTRYSVRSTAVSGVGLVLSIGAGLFLAVWWARHWRQSRNTKLVDSGRAPS